jgi:chaperonin cofactor prefoldin
MSKQVADLTTISICCGLATMGLVALAGPSSAFARDLGAQPEQGQTSNAVLLQRMSQLEYRLATIERQRAALPPTASPPSMMTGATSGQTLLALQSAVATLEARSSQLQAQVSTLEAQVSALQQGLRAQQAAFQDLQTQYKAHYHIVDTQAPGHLISPTSLPMTGPVP